MRHTWFLNYICRDKNGKSYVKHTTFNSKLNYKSSRELIIKDIKAYFSSEDGKEVQSVYADFTTRLPLISTPLYKVGQSLYIEIEQDKC